MGLRITEIWCYGAVGDDYGGITADMMKDALMQIPKSQEFNLRIFSDGGSFDEAMSMHSLISQRGNKSHGIVDGMAASAASLLLQATSDRSMAKHSRQMIHQVHGSPNGSFTADDFRGFADQMDATNKTLVAIYMKNWKGTESELMAALSKDTFLSAEQSVAVGLSDRVVEGLAIAARINTKLFKYNNVPDDVIQADGPFVPPWFDEMEKQLEECLK